MSIQTNKAKSHTALTEGKSTSEPLTYPVDLSQFLSLAQITLDAKGIPYHENPIGYDPTTIAQYALIKWNEYPGSNAEGQSEAFLKQAFWLVEHEVHMCEGAGGWPIAFPYPDISSRALCLSSLTQGVAISVLLRAYQLTQEEGFFEVARRAVHVFEQEILDGGVSTPVGSEGIFFEEVAVYPTTHTLVGCIFAMLGLYEYLLLTGDAQIRGLIERSHATLHALLNEFDAGFWTYTDLLQRRLASPSQLALQVALLEALARYSDCTHCASFASNWKGRQRRLSSRLRYLFSSQLASYGHALRSRVQTLLFPRGNAGDFLRVCVPVTVFPVLGGTRAVLAGVAQVTADIWRIEYLTHYVGPSSDVFVIHRFGIARMFPPQFPNVWLYCITGFCKLISLMRKGAGYHVIMPQDGVFTSAFAALAGKLAGVRVVCIDHGNLTLINSRAFRVERIQALETKNWSQPHRLLARFRYACYWPSQRLLAKFAARFVDHFLIPGIEGDGVEEHCRQLGIGKSRVTRFASVIDIDRHRVPDGEVRSRLREEKGIAADAIVISLVSRLTPEKGIGVALEGISQALSILPRAVCARVRIIIAGEGPLRNSIEEEIRARGLSQNYALWGEVSPTDVIALLGISDIFLYTSTRGACFSMSVLEAMASGCAVIASTEPLSNAYLLAEGRGIAIPSGDIEQTAAALARLINDPEGCHQMGRLAREHIKQKHSPALFRRTLLRATQWSDLETLLKESSEGKNDLASNDSAIEFSCGTHDLGGLR
jgi:glycosyltransferase involved in cell wall biosynthesis